jgi:hypothetical protein
MPKRTPIENPPKSCFGTEYESADSKCLACPHGEECRKYLGSRVGYHSLRTAKFRLVPEKLAIKVYDVSDPEDVDVQRLYERCYKMVFGESKIDYVRRLEDGEQRIKRGAAQSECSLEMFILCNMLGWKKMNKDRRFYATVLMGNGAVKRVEMYHEACRKLYGVFDARAIMSFLGLEDEKADSIQSSFYSSEVVAATFIVGCKVAGTKDILEQMYLEKEIAFDPVWLAIEPSYEVILRKHLEKPVGTREQLRHRYRVTSALRELKRSQAKAISAFQLRERTAARVLVEVLQRYGLTVDDLEIGKSVTDMLTFWAKLGLAVQRYLTVQAMDGDESAMRRLEK